MTIRTFEGRFKPQVTWGHGTPDTLHGYPVTVVMGPPESTLVWDHPASCIVPSLICLPLQDFPHPRLLAQR
jgi:hypothetical protein